MQKVTQSKRVDISGGFSSCLLALQDAGFCGQLSSIPMHKQLKERRQRNIRKKFAMHFLAAQRFSGLN